MSESLVGRMSFWMIRVMKAEHVTPEEVEEFAELLKEAAELEGKVVNLRERLKLAVGKNAGHQATH